MIDPDALETDHPALARALGGGAEARAAIDDLVALLRRAGVELPSYPLPSDPPAEPLDADGEIAGVDEETAVSRGEFFQILTGNVPDRLTD